MKLYIQVTLVCGLVALLTVGLTEGCVFRCMRGMIGCKRAAEANGSKDFTMCCDEYKSCYSQCKPGREPKCMPRKRGSWNKRMENYLEQVPLLEDPYF